MKKLILFFGVMTISIAAFAESKTLPPSPTFIEATVRQRASEFEGTINYCQFNVRAHTSLEVYECLRPLLIEQVRLQNCPNGTKWEPSRASSDKLPLNDVKDLSYFGKEQPFTEITLGECVPIPVKTEYGPFLVDKAKSSPVLLFDLKVSRSPLLMSYKYDQELLPTLRFENIIKSLRAQANTPQMRFQFTEDQIQELIKDASRSHVESLPNTTPNTGDGESDLRR